MKRFILLITLSTLLVSQAFGSALCPSVCKALKPAQAIEEAPSCHKPSKKQEPANEMPMDCGIQTMINSLSTFNVSTNILSVDFNFDREIKVFSAFDLFIPVLQRLTNNTFSFHYRSTHPPGVHRPIYLLNQSYLI
jgi:hypothetical protein